MEKDIKIPSCAELLITLQHYMKYYFSWIKIKNMVRESNFHWIIKWITLLQLIMLLMNIVN